MPSSNVNFDVTDAFLLVFRSLVHNRNERSKQQRDEGRQRFDILKFCLLILFISHFPILGSLFYSIHIRHSHQHASKRYQPIYVHFILYHKSREGSKCVSFHIQRRVSLMFLMWHVYKRSTFYFSKTDELNCELKE